MTSKFEHPTYVGDVLTLCKHIVGEEFKVGDFLWEYYNATDPRQPIKLGQYIQQGDTTLAVLAKFILTLDSSYKKHINQMVDNRDHYRGRYNAIIKSLDSLGFIPKEYK